MFGFGEPTERPGDRGEGSLRSWFRGRQRIGTPLGFRTDRPRQRPMLHHTERDPMG